jgi:hypothetical protein
MGKNPMPDSFTVFVCSTFDDLEREREGVLDAIRRVQQRHNAMEFFGARPGWPIKVCLDEVRERDLLVVIVRLKYGSLPPGMGISYSPAEYEEGARLNKPCLVYLRDDDIPILAKFVERDPDKLKLLETWKQALNAKHTVAKFEDWQRLAVQVAADIGHFLLERQFGARLAQTAEAKGVPEAPLREVLKRLGETEVAEAEIPDRLAKAADELIRLRADLAKLRNDRPELAAIRARASALIDRGEFDAARAALNEGRLVARVGMPAVIRGIYAFAAFMVAIGYVFVALDAVTIARAVYTKRGLNLPNLINLNPRDQTFTRFADTPAGVAFAFNLDDAFNAEVERVRSTWTVFPGDARRQDEFVGISRTIKIFLDPSDDGKGYSFRLGVGQLGEMLSGPYVDIDRSKTVYPKSLQEDCGLREVSYNRRLAGRTLFSEYFPVLKYSQGKCELFSQTSSSPTLKYLINRIKLVKNYIMVDMLRVGQSYYVFKHADGTVSSDMNDGWSAVPADLVKALAFDGSECEKYRFCVIPLGGNVAVKPCDEIVVPVPRSETVRTEYLRGMPESPYCIEAEMDNVIKDTILRFYSLTSLDAITFHVAGLASDEVALDQAVQRATLIDDSTQFDPDPELGMWSFASSIFKNGIHSKKSKFGGFDFDLQSAVITIVVVFTGDLILASARIHRKGKIFPWHLRHLI